MQKNVLKKLFISHKNDFILGAVLLLAALCLFIMFHFIFQNNGKFVKVQQGDEVVGYYPLDEDGEFEFRTYYGYNILVIEDGSAYISDASCKDHLCEKTGKISQVGETIICLPNELFVTITGSEVSQSKYDDIAQ